MARKEGFVLIAGEGESLRQHVSDYLQEENAVVRGFVNADEREHYIDQFSEQVEDVTLVAVDADRTTYIPIMPIIRASLTGDLGPIPYVTEREAGSGVISGIISIVPDAQDIRFINPRQLYEEDRVLLKKA